MRLEYENEMGELRRKMESEKETKAKMASEVEKMKREYEEKLKGLEARAHTAKVSRSEGGVQVTVQSGSGQSGLGELVKVNGGGHLVKSQDQQEALSK